MLAQQIEEDIIRWRRDLHRIPELGIELPQTSGYVQKVLNELGIEYYTVMDGNAIVALIRGTMDKPVIALRADMDALPIVEETGLAFASENGRMHACGHDGHTAMLLGAAMILQSQRHLLKGCVKLLFQPGEEYPGGALPMIEAGVLQNPPVDAVIGMHNGHISTEVPHGMVGIKAGPLMASTDKVQIRVKGKGAHGAYPQESVDPVTISQQIGSALQTLVSRETKPTDSVVLSICKVNGGSNFNIIPDEVVMEGTVRTLSGQTRIRVAQRIKELCKGIAQAMQGDAEIIYENLYPPLINDEEFTKQFSRSAEKIVGAEKVYWMKEAVMGGEDMAYFLERVPGTFFFLTNPGVIDGHIYPHHNSRFDLNESTFATGSALLVQTVLDYLQA
ncbi:M20 family metallopeptidase [Clostridiaceae bacterium HFYG-1003]|nr:M20 family metallopeptidase [Clostridiaceae bacterium HFYG-1003]